MKKLSPLFSLALAAIYCVSASAISSETLDFLDKNGIYYYNPYGFSDNCLPGLSSYDGVATAGLSDLQSAFVDQYHNIAIQLSSEYGIPWEAVVAQGIVESASGTSNFARERNNFFGIGAVDSNPSAAASFSSPAEGWKGYYEFINNNSRYRAAGAFNYPDDPYGYIAAIKAAGYATSPTYVATVSSVIKAVQNRATEKNWSSSRITDPSIASSLYACSSTTQGNGDINSTALALSWSDRSHSLSDPKAEYSSALDAVGLTSYGDGNVRIGASCDAFVATVLRFSGADPNVVCCGAANMLSYFISHPEIYEEIPNTGSSSNLQPGDIRASYKHVEIYTVDESGTGRIASASYGDRTADHGIGYYSDSSFRIFRVKGSNS